MGREWYRCKTVVAWLGACCLAGAMAGAMAGPAGGVEIRRTRDGIPHIRAAGWRELGYGYGYAQAEDALCTLAEAFVTFRGRRSFHWGADARPREDSTFGRPRNLELDLFFTAFADTRVLAEYRRQQPAELNALIDGFAAGYNRYLHDARAGARAPAAAPCLREPWVTEIAAEDVFRRMYAANLAAGYAKFIPEIVNAAPGVPALAAGDLPLRLAGRVGTAGELGSNAIAFGRAATGTDAGLLFGNPHWYWSGPDRFYQAHLTIPGRLNVAGAAFLGIPVIMIGFNEQVAWTHTVSDARRFGLFQLALDPADPTAYRYDGAREAMQPSTVSVTVRGADGAPVPLTRTLYRSRHGPLIDLGAAADPLGWHAATALAIRDVNADNFRVFRTFFYWNQARSLDDFVAIQRREAGIPWANTVAIGRGDGRVWYADVGAVPNVPDALRTACTPPLGRLFAAADDRAPVLDGSRSACDWRLDARAQQPGAMPVDAQPGLFREDYVANMNDSYWLANPHQPLEGFAAVLGGERLPLSLRGRAGHALAQALLVRPGGGGRGLGERLRTAVLDARVHSATLFKASVVAQVCRQRRVEVGADALDGAAVVPSRVVDLGAACRVLARWRGTGDAVDRGAQLWDAFWSRVERIPEAERYREAFSAAAPLRTPAVLAGDDPRFAQALGAAVLALSARGEALDAPRGGQLYARSGGQRVPLYGGCGAPGYLAVACNVDGGYAMGPGSYGNSYLQVVGFGAGGVEAYTLLAHGLSDAAFASGGAAAAPLRRYAAKRWLRLPWREEEIARDPALRRVVLQP